VIVISRARGKASCARGTTHDGSRDGPEFLRRPSSTG
jgi:hypothetical protein